MSLLASSQEFPNRDRSRSALTHRRGDLFGASMTRVPSDENSRNARLERERFVFGMFIVSEVVTCQHESILIQFYIAFQETYIRHQPDKNKCRGGMDILRFVAVFVVIFDRLKFGVVPLDRVHN